MLFTHAWGFTVCVLKLGGGVLHGNDDLLAIVTAKLCKLS